MTDRSLERRGLGGRLAEMSDEDSLRELMTITVDSIDLPETLRSAGGSTLFDPPVTTPMPSTVSHRLEGTTVAGRYELLHLIARGGMGRVYLARDLEQQIHVAVKIMHDHIALHGEHVERFRREASAASCLDHPNIVKVLDFGPIGETFYITMEYIDGECLSEWLDAQTEVPSLSEILPILTQTLDALINAHAAGVVHRDLKPDNILLVCDALGEYHVKVVDFGLARVPDAAAEDGSRCAGAVAGTPAYMSPEQCLALDASHSTDLYAWGCILTEMLQLEPPFSGSSVREVIAKHMFDTVPGLNRPSDAEPVPPALERLRRELLSKSSKLRPASAIEVRDRLIAAMGA